jgi:hypothetical protein
VEKWRCLLDVDDRQRLPSIDISNNLHIKPSACLHFSGKFITSMLGVRYQFFHPSANTSINKNHLPITQDYLTYSQRVDQRFTPPNIHKYYQFDMLRLI